MGCVKEGISTVSPQSGSQTQTETLSGWQKSHHRRHEKAVGAEAGGDASFAPTSSASTEEGLKAALKRFGVTDAAIDNAIRQVNETGSSMVQL